MVLSSSCDFPSSVNQENPKEKPRKLEAKKRRKRRSKEKKETQERAKRTPRQGVSAGPVDTDSEGWRWVLHLSLSARSTNAISCFYGGIWRPVLCTSCLLHPPPPYSLLLLLQTRHKQPQKEDSRLAIDLVPLPIDCPLRLVCDVPSRHSRGLIKDKVGSASSSVIHRLYFSR